MLNWQVTVLYTRLIIIPCFSESEQAAADNLKYKPLCPESDEENLPFK
jgi:hypothetical protein